MGFFTDVEYMAKTIFGLDSRNPFQGGMGFFTRMKRLVGRVAECKSQSLSGWDGVFHLRPWGGKPAGYVVSQSLSGWDGVFH